jgi:ATP-dependent Clp protease ATP-binding subunit ClpX
MSIAQTEARPRPVYCSFCGKSQHETQHMLAGPVLAAICKECIEQGMQLLREKEAHEAELVEINLFADVVVNGT